MGFFNKNKTTDERIAAVQNKIYKELFIVVMVICVLSIAVKLFLYGLHQGMYVIDTEVFILFFLVLYFLVRASNLGIYSQKVEMHDQKSKIPMRVKVIYIGMLIGFLFSGGLALRNAILYGDDISQSLFTFFSIFIFCFFFYIPIFILLFAITHKSALKRSKKVIDKQLEESDEDDDAK